MKVLFTRRGRTWYNPNGSSTTEIFLEYADSTFTVMYEEDHSEIYVRQLEAYQKTQPDFLVTIPIGEGV